MTTKRITARLLESKGACADQVAKFHALWPRGVIPTEALALEHSGTFDFRWAVINLLSASALAEYKRVRDAAWAEYKRVCASAWAEYERVRGPARAEYERVCVRGPARAEYERVCASAWAEYERVCVLAFVAAWAKE